MLMMKKIFGEMFVSIYQNSYNSSKFFGIPKKINKINSLNEESSMELIENYKIEILRFVKVKVDCSAKVSQDCRILLDF